TVDGRLRQYLIEAAIGQGRIGEGLREVERAVAEESLTKPERARLWAWSSTCRAITWDLPGAVETAYRALEASEELGDEVGAGVALGNLAVDLAETTGIRRGTLVGHSLRSLIAVHRGDLTMAEREATAAEAEAAAYGPQWRPDWMMWARALLLEAEGRPHEALQALARAWSLCSKAGVAAEYPVIGPDLVRMAIAVDRFALAEEVT